MDGQIEYLDEAADEVLELELKEETSQTSSRAPYPKNIWDPKAANLMVQLISKWLPRIGDVGYPLTKAEMYRIISHEMDRQGFNYSATQIISRHKFLLKKYARKLEKEKGTMLYDACKQRLLQLCDERMAQEYGLNFDDLVKEDTEREGGDGEEGEILPIRSQPCPPNYIWDSKSNGILVNLLTKKLPLIGQPGGYRSKCFLYRKISEYLKKIGYNFNESQIASRHAYLLKKIETSIKRTSLDDLEEHKRLEREFAILQGKKTSISPLTEEEEWVSEETVEPVEESNDPGDGPKMAIWNEDSTKLLISIAIALIPHLGREVSTKANMFRIISKELMDIGYPFTDVHVRTRYDYLRRKRTHEEFVELFQDYELPEVNVNRLLGKKELSRRKAYNEDDRRYWSNADTDFLLMQVKKLLPKIGTEELRSRQEMYAEISRRFKQRGFAVTPRQVGTRIIYLNQRYKKAVDTAKANFNYFDQVAGIFADESTILSGEEEQEEDEEEVVEEKHFCRVCLELSTNTDPFNTKIEEFCPETSETFSRMYATVSGYKVLDAQPTLICDGCKEKLIYTYNFVVFCQRNEKILQHQLGGNEEERPVFEEEDPIDTSEIKEEPMDEDSYVTEEPPPIEKEHYVKPKSEKKAHFTLLQIDPCLESPSAEVASTSDEHKEILGELQHQTFIRCRLCFAKVAGGEAELQVHTRRLHSGTKFGQVIACELCNKLLVQQEYKQHIKNQHSSDERELSSACRHCDLKFLHDETRKLHEIAEHCRISCRLCNLAVKSHQLSTHALKVHELAGYTIEQAEDLDVAYEEGRWMMSAAYEASEKICAMCGKSVPNLDRHITFFHTKKRQDSKEPKLCPLCGVQCRNRSALKYHQSKVHSGINRRVICAYCDKQLKDKNYLKQHFGTVHGFLTKWYQCHICGQNFTSKSVCDDHISRHAGAPKHLQCGECKERFASYRQLNSHKYSRHSGKIFQCSWCGNQYNRRAGLRAHMNVHKEEKEYACPSCDYQATTNLQIRQHVGRHHPEFPLAKGMSFNTAIKDKVASHFTRWKKVTSGEGGFLIFNVNEKLSEMDHFKQPQ